MLAAHTLEIDPAALVRADHVHRSVYTDPDIFALEMDRIFGRAWIYLAHDSEVKAPGDYVVRHIGVQAVVLTRGADGAVRAIFNRCTHRGATLCAFDRGSAPHGHKCPYHGWVFGADGALRSVPNFQNYKGVMDLKDYAVQKIPRLANYRGFLFGSLAEDGPDLETFLGHMRTSIDNLVDRSPTGELECAPLLLRHYYRANWKMTFENVNDTIHPGFAHSASVVSAKHVAGEIGGKDQLTPTLGMMLANGKPIQFFQDLDMVTTPYGHSYIGGHMGANYTPDTQDTYFSKLEQFHGREKALGVMNVDRHLTIIYPSSSWHARYQTLRIVRPVRHDLTEVIGFTFRLVGAPEETFVNAIEYCNGANSAASPVIADDLELYERCLLGNSFSGQMWIPMNRGLLEIREQTPEVTRTPATSEQYVRNQFAAWLTYMSAS
jgi:phenylpropionate dioxygenase-like ring-hydroxylating dioxygenase large terminal subunit